MSPRHHRRRHRTDHGTVVNVHTHKLGDELAPAKPGKTNLITSATLTVASGAISGWSKQNVTVTGTTGNPTVEPTDPTAYAWLRSPAFAVTAGQMYAAAINVGNTAQTVALVLPDQTVEVTSSNRVAVSGTPSVSGSAYLELRWWPTVTAGFGAGTYGDGIYGG